MGVIAPPAGITVQAVFGVAQGAVGGVELETIFKGLVPFFVAIVGGIPSLMVLPQIILMNNCHLFR